MNTTKEEALQYLKDCDLCEMYDFFDICRERHNNAMLRLRK